MNLSDEVSVNAVMKVRLPDHVIGLKETTHQLMVYCAICDHNQAIQEFVVGFMTMFIQYNSIIDMCAIYCKLYY